MTDEPRPIVPAIVPVPKMAPETPELDDPIAELARILARHTLREQDRARKAAPR